MNRLLDEGDVTLRARALEALRQAEEYEQARNLASEAAERRRRWEKLQSVLEPWGLDVAEGVDAVTVEGLRLVAEPSRYGIAVTAGASCRECSAFARLAPVSELRDLGSAYRALEALGDAPPCHLVGSACVRRREVAQARAQEDATAISETLDATRDRALGDALRTWLGGELEGR